MPKLFVLQKGFDRVHIGVGYRCLVQQPQRLFAGLGSEKILDVSLQGITVLHAERIGAVKRVVR